MHFNRGDSNDGFQLVSLNGCHSQSRAISSGVIQGRVFGLLQFPLYTSKNFMVILHATHLQYDVDILPVCSFETVHLTSPYHLR